MSLEHGLAGLEARFARIRREKFDQQLPLTEGDHINFAAFVAAAQFRTRSSRDHHASQWSAVLELMEEVAENMKAATPAQKRMARVLGGSASKKQTLSRGQVRQLAKHPLQLMMSANLRAVTPVLAKMNMLILCTDDPVGFITSDRPVAWFDPEAYKRPPIYRSVGLESRTMEVTMPLSPQQCIVFAWESPTGYAEASKLALYELNRRHRALCSEHFVVRTNATREYWFKEFDPPDDAWEKRNPTRDAGQED